MYLEMRLTIRIWTVFTTKAVTLLLIKLNHYVVRPDLKNLLKLKVHVPP